MIEATDLVIIGGGPAGIEAALAAKQRGFRFVLLEAGEIGASIRRWSHVRLFSPWEYNTSEQGRENLRANGRPVPQAATVPTGADYLERYLLPIAQSPQLASSIRTGNRVTAVGRAGISKSSLIGDPGRAEHPFQISFCRDGASDEMGVLESPVLIDASGVYDQPTRFCEGDPPALESGHPVERYIPDVNRDRDRFVGKHTAIVGGGFSAATALRDLLAVAAESPGTKITWILRGTDPEPLKPVPEDVLPERARLVEDTNRIATAPETSNLTILRGSRVHAVEPSGSGLGLSIVGDHEQTLTADHVLALTGYRPDTSLLAECQVHLCYASDGLMKLSAALLGAMGGGDSAGDCMAVPAAGIDILKNPEPNLFVIGSKSYGRFSHYLLRSGIGQVETIFDALPAPGSVKVSAVKHGPA